MLSLSILGYCQSKPSRNRHIFLFAHCSLVYFWNYFWKFDSVRVEQSVNTIVSCIIFISLRERDPGNDHDHSWCFGWRSRRRTGRSRHPEGVISREMSFNWSTFFSWNCVNCFQLVSIQHACWLGVEMVWTCLMWTPAPEFQWLFCNSIGACWAADSLNLARL